MSPRGWAFIFWAVVALMVLPQASAQNQELQAFTVSGGLGQAVEIRSYHQFPDEAIPNDHSFYITSNLFADDNDNDFDVDANLYQLHGGCVVNHDHKNVTSGQSVALSIYIDMNGAETCSWHIIGEVLEGATIVHQFHETGTVVAYEMIDIGQDSHGSLSTYAGWSLFFFVLLMFTLWFGKSFVWLLPALAATIGLTGAQLDAFPVAPQGALMLYLLSIWLVWWTSRRLDRRDAE